MPAHMRTEIYQRARQSIYPPHLGAGGAISVEINEDGTRRGKQALDS